MALITARAISVLKICELSVAFMHMFLPFASALALLACRLIHHLTLVTRLTLFSIFSCATLVFHGVVSCRSHKYNQIGTNKEAVPVIVTPEHPQESTSYQGAAGYQSLA